MKVFHSKKVVLPQGITEAWVIIADGKITAVEWEQPRDSSVEVIELGHKVLMPGVIDPHVHINEPGREEWEGFETATKAAIAGGVTTLVDMPLNASPVTTTAEAFDQKLVAAKNKLYANAGFWGGLVPGNTDDIEPLIEKGVLGFKAFLTHSGIDEFPNVTRDDLDKAMPIIARHGLPLLVHCELSDPALVSIENTQPLEEAEQTYKYYLQSRPKQWEDDAIAMMIELCEKYNCRVHIVHLSSADSITQIAAAKAKGLPLTVETGQHYLYFNAETIGNGQTQFKCAPPIREAENNALLWQALQDGIIDLVATDHSPATPDLKETSSGNFMKAWGGIASIQYALPALWTAAKKRNITLVELVIWLCEQPAKLIGKEHSKGKIAIGFDADLVVFNEAAMFVVDETTCHHKHKLSPYMGEQLFGVVEQTFLAGELVYQEGNFAVPAAGLVLLS